MSEYDTRMSLPPVILFGGHENVIPLVRSFAARSIPVYILNERWAEVQYSRYVRRIPLPSEPPYPQAAMDFLTGPASDALKGSVLLAGLDEELELIANHREKLVGKFRLDLSNPVAQRMMLNKLATYQAARRAGVATPRFWEVRSIEDILRLREELVYPLIVKPKFTHLFQSKFAAKFIVVGGFQQLLDSYQFVENANIEAMLVEKVPGPDSNLCSYYTYLDEDGNALFDFTKRIIRRYPKNMGIGSYHITDRVEHVRELSLKLFRHVGLQGLANAEFIYDARDGQLKLIECNARFTGGNSLVAKAGFDLGNFVYNRIVGISQPPLTDFRIGLRQWDPQRDVLAFLELRKRGEITFLQWMTSIMHRQTFALFSWRDPIPSLVRLVTRISKVSKFKRSPNQLSS